jgi:mRNA-degrading endonuclease YafQ of YafQ-DinJ toxin-antitoxin module
MPYKLIYTESYNRRAAKFLGKHPELVGPYRKVLQLLEINPRHQSLRLHALSEKLQGLHAVSTTLGYRITLEIIMEENEIILVNVGDHDAVYR